MMKGAIKLKPKYEWLKITNCWDDEYVLDDDGLFLSWAENIPEGWYAAFGEKMIDELNEILVKYNFVDEYKIIQIKEKFGKLRWYDNGVPEQAYDEYCVWLDKYEMLSGQFCIDCGKTAEIVKNWWILPLCEDHR